MTPAEWPLEERIGRYRILDHAVQENGAYRGRDEIRGEPVWLSVCSVAAESDLDALREAAKIRHGLIEPVLDILYFEPWAVVIESTPSYKTLSQIREQLNAIDVLQLLHQAALVRKELEPVANLPRTPFRPHWIYRASVFSFGGLLRPRAQDTTHSEIFPLRDLLRETLGWLQASDQYPALTGALRELSDTAPAEDARAWIESCEQVAGKHAITLQVGTQNQVPLVASASRFMPVHKIILLLPPLIAILWLLLRR